jgi:hypothetical protein
MEMPAQIEFKGLEASTGLQDVVDQHWRMARSRPPPSWSEAQAIVTKEAINNS